MTAIFYQTSGHTPIDMTALCFTRLALRKLPYKKWNKQFKRELISDSSVSPLCKANHNSAKLLLDVIFLIV